MRVGRRGSLNEGLRARAKRWQWQGSFVHLWYPAIQRMSECPEDNLMLHSCVRVYRNRICGTSAIHMCMVNMASCARFFRSMLHDRPLRFCSCQHHSHLIFFVSQLLTIPANVLSSLVIEGYKKMMLVSLIVSGEVPPLPKYASNSVTRHLKSHTSDYEALVSCFQVRKFPSNFRGSGIVWPAHCLDQREKHEAR